MQWCPITHERDGHKLTFFINTDGVMLDGVRYGVSAYETQQAAYMLDGMMPTPLLLDLQHLAAPLHIDPQSKDYSDNYNEMMTEQAAIDHSRRVDAAIDGRPGMPSPIGKHWVLSAFTAPGEATLYGWPFDPQNTAWRGASYEPAAHQQGVWSWPDVRVIQANPTRSPHDDKYRDYMPLKLVKRLCYVDGQRDDLARVVLDPDLCGLAVAEAVPLPYAEQPGVAPFDPDAPEPRPTLRRGDTGSDVEHMQGLLPGVDVDGIFGQNTEAALVAYQQGAGLVADGICGAATWAALEG